MLLNVTKSINGRVSKSKVTSRLEPTHSPPRDLNTETIRALESRAYKLYFQASPFPEWAKVAQSDTDGKGPYASVEEFLESLAAFELSKTLSATKDLGKGDADLIDMTTRAYVLQYYFIRIPTTFLVGASYDLLIQRYFFLVVMASSMKMIPKEMNSGDTMVQNSQWFKLSIGNLCAALSSTILLYS